MTAVEALYGVSGILAAVALVAVAWLFVQVVAECVAAGFGPEPAPAPRPFVPSFDQPYRQWMLTASHQESNPWTD